MDVDEALAAADTVGAASSIPDFVIDEDMRVVAVPANGVVLGVEGDKDTNTVMFSLPKTYRGCDLSGFSARVTFVNPSNEAGWYDVADLAASADDADTLTFTWLVSDVAVRYQGTVRFAVNFRELDGTTVKRAWNTTVAEVTSLEGLPAPTSQPASSYEDLLAVVDARIAAAGIGGAGSTLTDAQLNALNSGVTADKVKAYDAYSDTNTTYTISKSGSTVTLTGSDGSTSSVEVAGGSGTGTDTNTTYTLTVSGHTLTLAPSDGGTAQTVTLPDEDTTYSNATASSAGLMSAADKAKLDGIAAGANAYVLPTASATTKGGVKVGSGLSISSTGVLSATGSGSSAGGTATPATTSSIGGVIVGNGLSVTSDGTLSVTGSTTEPVQVPDTYPVAYSLTNASCSPSPETVTDGQSYTLTFTVSDGYEWDGTPTVSWTDGSGEAHSASATNGSVTFVPSDVEGSVTVTATGKAKAVTPTPTGVISDISTASWSDLSANVKAYTASDLSSWVGQEKSVEIEGYGTFSFRCVGVGHDKATSDSSANTATFECTSIVTTHVMNATNTNSGGWESSNMRSWLSSDVLPKLPSDLQAVIIAVDKQNTPNFGASPTSDKLWLESVTEVGLTDDAIDGSTTYAYWSDKSNSDRIKKNSSGSANRWWLRSADPSGTINFRSVYTDGSRRGYVVSDTYGVAPCFSI